MAIVETKYVEVGAISTFLYGFLDNGTTGDIGNTLTFTVTDKNVDGLYSGADIFSIYWSSGGTVFLQLTGNRPDSGWLDMDINGTTYTRASRSSYAYDSGLNRTTWQWTSATNPFGTSLGSRKKVEFDGGTPAVSGTLTPATLTQGESLYGGQVGVGPSITANINTTGTYHWDLERAAGAPSAANSFSFTGPTNSDAGSLGYPTSGFSATANVNTSFTVGGPINYSGTSNLGHQGVEMTIDLFTGASRTGTLLDTVNWTIYEDTETGTTVTTSAISISSATTTFSQQFNYSWNGTNTVTGRIRNVTTDTVVETGLSFTGGSGTLTRNLITAPPDNTTQTFRIEFDRGDGTYVNGVTWTVQRGTPLPEETPENRDHNRNEVVAMANVGGTINYMAPEPNTTIYRRTSSGTITVERNTNVNAPEAGNLGQPVVNAYYYADKPVHFFPNGNAQHTLQYKSVQGYQFAYYANRNSPHTIYLWSDQAQTIKVYDGVSGGIVGTTESSTIAISADTVTTYNFANVNAAATPGPRWVFFTGTSPFIATASGNGGSDKTALAPMASIVYRYGQIGGGGRFSIAQDGATPSNVANSVIYDSTHEVASISIGDGAGGDNESGVGAQNLSPVYLWGQILTDFMIAAPFSGTIVIELWNGSEWEIKETFSPTGTSTSPTGYIRDAVNGFGVVSTDQDGSLAGSATFESGATLWRWRGTDNFFLRLNRSADEESQYGYVPTFGQSPTGVYDNNLAFDACGFDYEITNGTADTDYRLITTNTNNASGLSGQEVTRRNGNGILIVGEDYLPTAGTNNAGYKLQWAETGTENWAECIGGTDTTLTVARRNNFTFTETTGASASTTYTSSVQVNGIIGSLTASLIGDGTFSVNSSATPGGTFNTSDKSITNGQYIHARTTNVPASTTHYMTIDVDGQQDTYMVTRNHTGGDFAIETKWVDVGTDSYSILSLTTTLYGYYLNDNDNPLFDTFGTISDTQNGASNASITQLYRDKNMTGAYWTDGAGQTANQAVNVRFDAIPPFYDNTAWSSIQIGATTYTRASANDPTPLTGAYAWNTTSNPFGTITGADRQITITGHRTPIRLKNPIGTIALPNDTGFTSFDIEIKTLTPAYSASTIYEVWSGSYGGTLEGSRNGDGIVTISDFIANDSSKTYYVTARLPVIYGGDNVRADLETFELQTSQFLIRPTIGLVSDDDRPETSVVTTITLDDDGIGGLLQYASSDNGACPPKSGWTTDNNITQDRGTTKYYWVSRGTNYAGTYDPEPIKYTVPIKEPDPNTTFTDAQAYNGRGGFVVEMINEEDGTTYDVRTGSYSGTIISTFNGRSGSEGAPQHVAIQHSLTSNTTTTLYVTASISADNGGDGTPINLTTFDVTTTAFSGTQYGFTMSTANNKGGGVDTFLTPDGSYPSTLTLTDGDTLRFTPISGFTFLSGTRSFDGSYTDGSTYRYFDVRDMTTNGTTTSIVVSGGFLGTNASKPYTISGDSIPTTPPNSIKASNAGVKNALLTADTITVAGLATGKTTDYEVKGHESIEVSKNGSPFFGGGETVILSGTFNEREQLKTLRIPRVRNGDTLVIRARSPQVYDIERAIRIEAIDGAETVTDESYFFLSSSIPSDNVYGMEVYDPSGNTTLSINSRSTRWVAQGDWQPAIPSSAATPNDVSITVPITGLENNEEWVVQLIVLAIGVQVTYEKTQDNLILTATNTGGPAIASGDVTISYLVGITG